MSERMKQQIRVAANVLINALTHPTLSENEEAQGMVAHPNFQPDELHHPSHDRLQAYTLGKCRAQEMAAIYQHLTDCPSCLARLDNLPGVDSFVLWLRMLMRFQGKGANLMDTNGKHGRTREGRGKDFEPDIDTTANFLQARTALVDGREVVLLDFEMLDFEPSPTTVAMRCSLDNIRKLTHTCLKALESFGDQPAAVLLKALDDNR